MRELLVLFKMLAWTALVGVMTGLSSKLVIWGMIQTTQQPSMVRM